MKTFLQLLFDLLLAIAVVCVFSALLMIVLGESGDMEALFWRASFATFGLYGIAQGFAGILVLGRKLIQDIPPD